MENNRVKDIDGNKYHTITIGSQEWMAGNLKVTHYRNGDSIANIIGGEDWATTDIGAYCIYKKSYGALYNWHATVDTRNIAPEGWHVPTDAEWTKLENYLKLHHPKSIMESLQSTSGWKDNTNGTDNYGFTVLPGGHRAYSSGFFLGIGKGAYFWSSTKSSDNGAYNRRFHNSNIYRNFGEHVRAGCAIRCLRDQSI